MAIMIATKPGARRRSYSIASARDNLARLVHDAEQGEPVQLTRHGKRVALIVSRQQFERISSSRPDFREALRQFRESADLEHLNLGPGYFAGLRDRSPGRSSRE